MPLYGRAPVCVARPSKTHEGAGGRPKVRDSDSPNSGLAVRAGGDRRRTEPEGCLRERSFFPIATELKKAP